MARSSSDSIKDTKSLTGLAPEIITPLMVKAGVPEEAVVTLRSNTLCAHFGLDDSGAQAHDALGDAQSVAYVLQYFLRSGALSAEDFARDRSSAA